MSRPVKCIPLSFRITGSIEDRVSIIAYCSSIFLSLFVTIIFTSYPTIHIYRHEKLGEPWPGHPYTSHICRCEVFPLNSCHGVFTNRFIFRTNFPGMRLPWKCHDQSQKTNFTASLDRNCLSFTKEKVY